ncbi:MAG: PcfJ domain-containing protein [Hyphomicrobiaceae bacterium]
MGPVSPRPREAASETVAERRLRRLNAFPQPFRKYIAGLTSCTPALEDLSDSFPALLFAMSTGYASVRRRQAAYEAVSSGQPLREAARLLGLPIWLRRIPAQAMTQPLPELPEDSDFATCLLSRVPDDPREAAVWFERVIVAYRLVGRDFALWVAREPRLMPPHTSDEDLQWMLAWAWASEMPTFVGHGMLRGSWNGSIGWKRARDEVAIWRKRIDLVGALALGPRDPWFENASIMGYDIVGLNSVNDYIAESAAMENCLDQYAAHLAYGRVRIFSVRKNGRSIADVEVTIKPDDAKTPCLAQIRGPRNRRAPPAIWQAVNAWLAAQPARAVDTSPTSAQATREAFRRFWRPYVDAAEMAGLPPHVLSRVLGRDSRRGRPSSRTTEAGPQRRAERWLLDDMAMDAGRPAPVARPASEATARTADPRQRPWQRLARPQVTPPDEHPSIEILEPPRFAFRRGRMAPR